MKWRSEVSETIGDELLISKTSSGLPVRIIRRPGMAWTSALLAVDYGSIDDQFVAPGRAKARKVPAGIAHFLEHKMFEKAEGDLSERFSAKGAQANAMTGHQMTGYVFNCTSDLEEHLETLFTITCEPYFTPELVDKEQGIIDQEIRGYDDHPGWRAWRALLEGLYHKHAARVDIAGTSKSIRKITADLLHLCHGAFYVPRNMVFTLVGDVDPEAVGDQVDELARRFYGAGRQPVAERVIVPEPETIKKARTRLEMSVSMPITYLGFKGPMGITKPKQLLDLDAAMTLFFEVLLSSAGPLHEELYAEGLITDDFNWSDTVEPGIAYAYVGGKTPDPKRLAARVEAAIADQLAKPLDPTRLEGARRRTIGDFIRSFDSSDSLTWTLAESHFQRWKLFDWPNVLADIGERRIRKLAATMLAPDRTVRVEVVPHRKGS